MTQIYCALCMYHIMYGLHRSCAHVFKNKVVMLSEPELVKQVLLDKDTFPSRGKSGLSDTVGEGLVELVTGKCCTHVTVGCSNMMMCIGCVLRVYHATC